MAKEARVKFNTSIGLSTTGNAGPTKGDSDVEVGTVWIVIAYEEGIISEKFLFGKNRKRIIGKAVNKALEMLFKQLI